MKKFFKYLGIAILLSISFFYTEKTASVVKELDDIMINIREIAKTHKIEPVEAIISNNTIIPGINGSEIDINKSYREMRYIGKYNEKFLEYKPIYIKNKLEDNFDKYIISGNKLKKEVSLVFIVENNDDITKSLNILKKNNITATFLFSGIWFENNNEKVYNVANSKHIIGSIGYNYSYNNSSYPWLDNVIKRVSKQKNSYCLRIDEESLKICSDHKNYTIDSDIILDNPLINTKQKLGNGSILIYKLNTYLENELELIIKYIDSKGLSLVNLEQLLKE